MRVFFFGSAQGGFGFWGVAFKGIHVYRVSRPCLEVNETRSYVILRGYGTLL